MRPTYRPHCNDIAMRGTRLYVNRDAHVVSQFAATSVREKAARVRPGVSITPAEGATR